MNSEENRPSPEEFLSAIKREESAQGRLKIFLGMAAGVGKTYAMLEEAKKLTKEGADIQVGIIDTHDRKETAALLEGLVIIPEKDVIYKNITFKELDLDEIIKRKPQIVLVDELAHTNIPGLRHEKRWQDVMEILDNGIDVYTALNVQHIESLKDVVENIAGVTIKETVPDIVIEKATSIIIIDLNPEELIKRLNEGKVYLGEQSKTATLNFFKRNKLTALREILLRYTAEKIDYDLHQMVVGVDSENSWKPREKLLVAVSSSPHSQKLIRATRRLAFNLEAPWIAVYVNTGKLLDEESELRVAKNLSLARDLGAEVITTNDPDVAVAIERIARRRGVTQIIIGRSPPKKFLSFSTRSNLLDELAKECSDIDIHVIRQEALLTKQQKQLKAKATKTPFYTYLLVFFWVLTLTILNYFLLPVLGFRGAGEFFFIAILCLCLFFNKRALFFGAFLISFIWFFLFLPESEKFTPESLLLLFIYILTPTATGILKGRYRQHEEMLQKREETYQGLYRIMKQIAAKGSLKSVLNGVIERLQQIFDSSFEILLKDYKGELNSLNSSKLASTEKEKAAATWVFENGMEAGWSTDTLPFAENLYLPMKNLEETFGVLIFKKKRGKIPSLEEKNFLYTVAQQLCNRVERSFADEKAKQHEIRLQMQKINQRILKRIATEFRPSLMEAKKSVNFFKKKLMSLKNPALNQNFLAVERAYETFNKTFEHLAMLSFGKEKE